jgi:predicted metal-dependent hydrolase/CheY-like chemotaxis protein
MSQPPLILGLVSDLFFAVQIENAVNALGYRVQWVERGDEVEPDSADPGAVARIGEPLTGPGSRFVKKLVEWQPALVIVELNSTAIPWPEWIAALKSSPATRRIPVVAFGPHADVTLSTRAMDVGCDIVVAKSRFVSALPELIQKHARLVDAAALETDCAGELSPLALKGVELFNRQEYFEAHEELERAWNEEPGPARELYRGILQVAVAYLQVQRHNYDGALKMFLRLRQWLDPLPDQCRGVDVAQLRADALAARAELERLGPEGIREFDRSLFKPLRMTGDG